MGESEEQERTEAAPETEEELRARIEEGLRKVRVQDVLLESIVTLVNLTARRIAKDDERDLDQAKVGIDAVRAVVDLLEPEAQAQVREALSELQMLYARAAGGSAPPEGGVPGASEEGGSAQPGEAAPGEPPAGGASGGPGRPGPGLWVPPGSS
jgi:hypothetical protein